MFQVTTLDLNPRSKKTGGAVDFSQDFFGKTCNLTVKDSSKAGWARCRFQTASTLSAPRSAPRTPAPRAMPRSSQVIRQAAFYELEVNLWSWRVSSNYLIPYALVSCAESQF